MTNLNTCISLLPLRMEIRKMFGNVPFTPKPPYRSFSTEEYWIRWYPDDLAICAPPKPVTKEEKRSFEEFQHYCKEQLEYTLNSHTPLADLTQEFVQTVGRGSQENAEAILEVYNGRRRGDIGDFATLCKKYNAKTLDLINSLYDSKRTILPEKRIVGVRLGWDLYFDFNNPCLKWAWQKFVDQVGILRARYLVIETNPLFATEDNLYLKKALYEEGLKVLMPSKVQLFTVTENNGVNRVEPLTGAISIDPTLIFSLDLTNKSSWLTDFSIAESKGMATRIQGEKALRIKNASWILLTGYSPDTNTQIQNRLLFQQLLSGLHSRGEISLIAQDTPTNNTEKSETGTWEDPKGIEPFDQTLLQFSPLSDVALLCKALGIKESLLAGISGADLKEQANAEAMALVIWRSCTGVFKGQYENVGPRTWNALESLFVKFIRARGALPVLRMRDNPYGVLPIIKLQDWQGSPNWLSEAEQQVLKEIKKIATLLKGEMDWLSHDNPTLASAPPPEQFNTLMNLLRLHPVSKDISQRHIPLQDGQYLFSEDPTQIGGSLVQDFLLPDKTPNPTIPGREYLEAIAFGEYVLFQNPLAGSSRKRIEFTTGDRTSVLEYPEFFVEQNKLFPIRYCQLHKILSLYIYKTEDGVTLNSEEEVTARLNGLKESAKALLSLEINILEVLLLECFDLLTFRLDAWISAFATIRMYETLTSSPPTLGVYGWLESPGKIEPTAAPSHYIQAPSLQQAATAALLHNGSINQKLEGGTNPYCINLSSKRVREGSLYLERIRQGYLPGEVLGYKLERSIHQIAALGSAVEDKDIYFLRERFPLPHCEDATNPNSALIDGKAFVDRFSEVETGGLSPAKVEALKTLKNGLHDITDAAADLAVAEMLYQFMGGNTARVAAWMDFLEGEVVAPELEFTHSVRNGKTEETRVYLSIPDCLEQQGPNASPLSIYDPILESFCNQLMPNWDTQQIICTVRGWGSSVNLTIYLGSFAQGLSMYLTPLEFVLGGKEEFLFRLRTFLLALWHENPSFMPLPENREGHDLINELTIEINEEHSSPYFQKAKSILRLLSNPRQNGAPSNRNPLEEPLPIVMERGIERTINWAAIAARLENRWNILKQLLGALQENSLSDPTKVLQRHLAELGFLQALTLSFSPSRETLWEEIKNRQTWCKTEDDRLKTLSGQEKVEALQTSLSKLIGRPNGLFLTPYQISSPDRLKIRFPQSSSSTLLSQYAEVRDEMKEVQILFNGHSPYKSTLQSTPNTRECFYSSLDQQSEKEGMIFILLDEWIEIIPNAQETTGVALKYPTPKTQAPNAILIATPPMMNPEGTWSHQLLAESLSETLELMKIRTLSTSQVIGDNNLGKYLPLTAVRTPLNIFFTRLFDFANILSPEAFHNVLLREEN